MGKAEQNSQKPFSQKAILVLIVLGLLSTLGIAVTSIFSQDGKYQNSPGSNSFSKSAVGHAVFVRLLAETDYQVLVSQYDTMGKIGDDSILMFIEPPARSASENHISYFLDEVPILLVLPKRRAIPSPIRRGWIGREYLLKPESVKSVAEYIVAGIEIVRPEHATHAWRHELGIDGNPEIDDLQLIQSDLVDPIIATEDGILFGRTQDRFEGGQPVWILSDPDLLATHGLARGWNADFAVAVTDAAANGRGTLVVDEIVHGFSMEPSLARAMFKAPFVYATLAAILAMMFFLLALTRRFGAVSRQTNSIQDSKAIFIENTARILHLANKEREALLRLMDDHALTVAEKLNAPRDLARKDLVGWLDEISRLRNISPDFGTIRLRVYRINDDDETKARRLLHQATHFYNWKQEILDDPKRH
jgi:hypothetical protein